jgi:hypothetical protein
MLASDDLAFRANAYREHTHLICRLPLDYLVLLARAFKAWGPDADIGTACHKGNDSAGFFTSMNNFPYHAQVHGFAGRPSMSPLDAILMDGTAVQKKR